MNRKKIKKKLFKKKQVCIVRYIYGTSYQPFAGNIMLNSWGVACCIRIYCSGLVFFFLVKEAYHQPSRQLVL